jgi:hypothetical protein
MPLTRQEHLELLATDGLADAAALAALPGFDVAAARRPGRLLADALAAPAGLELADGVLAALGIADPGAGLLGEALRADAPELADGVLAALGIADPGAGLLGEALRADAPELADDVLAALGIADPGAGLLGEALRADAPELADDVLAALGIADARVDLRGALHAGPAPALWDAVAADLGIEADPDALPGWPADADLVRAALVDPRGAPDVAGPVMARLGLERPVRRAAPRSYGFAGVALAAAAALLLVFTRPLAPLSEAGLALQLSPINQVEIEELSASEGAMVQVLQFDENAPTIIFIEDLGGDAEGATL